MIVDDNAGVALSSKIGVDIFPMAGVVVAGDSISFAVVDVVYWNVESAFEVGLVVESTAFVVDALMIVKSVIW